MRAENMDLNQTKEIIRTILQGLLNCKDAKPPGLKRNDLKQKKGIKQLLDKNKQLSPVSIQRLSGIIPMLEFFNLIQQYGDTNYYQVTRLGIKFLDAIKSNIKADEILQSGLSLKKPERKPKKRK